MTKHNLKNHLSWFLRTPQTVPLLDHICAVTDHLGDVGASLLVQDVAPVPESTLNNCTIPPVSPERQRPTVERNNNDITRGSTAEMARLQLAPTPAKQSRMLSQVKNVRARISNHTSTSAATLSSVDGTPKKHASSCNFPASSTSRRYARSEETSRETSYNDSDLGNYHRVIDIDEIDLTENMEGHTSSSATVEAFGEPRRLWREDSASRSAPLQKKTRKRTSDEYKADLMSHSPRKSGKRGRHETPLLGRLGHETEHDDPADHQPTPRTVIPPRTRSPAHFHGNMPRISTNSPADLYLEEEHEITQTSISTETRKLRSNIGILSTQQRMTCPGTKNTGTQNLPQPTPPLRDPQNYPLRLSPTRIIEDSENEDIENEAVKNGGGSPSVQGAKYELNLKTPVIAKSNLPGKPEGDEMSRESRSNVRLAKPHRYFVKEEVTSPTANVSLLVSEQPSPLKMQAATSHMSSSSQGKLPIQSLAGNNESVWQFLGMSHSVVDTLLVQLKSDKKRVHEAKVAQMMEDEGVSAEVEDRFRSTKQSLKALEELIALKASYVTKHARRDEIQNTLSRLLDFEGDQQADDEISALRKEVLSGNQELRTIESEVSARLNIGNIWGRLCSGGPHDGHEVKTVGVDSGRRPQEVLIASTQMNRPLPSIMRGQGSSQGYLPTKSQHTLKSPTATPQKKPPPSYNSPTAKCLNVAEATASPKVHHNRQDQGPYPLCEDLVMHSHSLLKQNNRSAILRSPQENNAEVDEFPFEDFNDDVGFSRRMGSPSMPFPLTEDFDDEGDDGYLCGAADELEQRSAVLTPSNSRRSTVRPALQETHGNVQRKPPAPSVTQVSIKQVQMQYPWSKAVKAALKDRFHLHGFRHNQLEAINATLAAKDTFVLMPTGGGKSLCYQLPAVVQSGRTRGVTVVISPLLSLMQDQVQALQRKGVQATLINSEVTNDHRRFVFEALRGPEVENYIQILYITPEMINKSGALIDIFHHLHKQKKLARIVIDEAHCVSQWGHDFRPDYKALGDARRRFSGVPVIALTATATENVKVDVIHNLGMEGCEVFTQSFNRPNLAYEVRTKVKGKVKETLDDIAQTINTLHKGQCGIVYCMSRINCEKVSNDLNEDYGIRAKYYHAKMAAEDKLKVQKSWQAGECNVIVATIAFGMGIDKPNVRFVIHYNIPMSLEGYYQETGRAGRDGKRSACYLYYGYGDTASLKRMIKDGDGSWEQKERQMQMLRNVVQFCENKSDCRRVQILAYFNEYFDRGKCNGGCDNCKSESIFENQDFSQYAQSAIKLVRRLQEQYVTLLHCVDVFRGSKFKKITELGHDQIAEHGLGSELERGDAERLFQRLLSEDALEEINRVNGSGFANQYIKLGRNSDDFLTGRRRVNIQIRISPNGKSKSRNGDRSSRRKLGPGVSAAQDDHYPASTNVSSPIQAMSRRRLVRKGDLQVLTEDSSEGEDGFPLFEPVRNRAVLSKGRERQLGPPIADDEKLARLNPTHRHVLDDFMANAKKQCSAIMLDRGLRSQPFSDRILREMAINFPLNQRELLKISGIEADKVERYGKRFLKLIEDAHNTYEALMRAQEDIPDDPNHRNVVEISDEDEELELGLGDSDDHEFSDEETSQYFQLAPDVAAFNAQLSHIQTLPSPSTRSTSKKPNTLSQRHGSGCSQRGRGGRKGGFSGARKWRDRSGASGMRRKKGSSTRTSNGSSNSGSFLTSKRAGGSRSGPANSTCRSIGLMPT